MNSNFFFQKKKVKIKSIYPNLNIETNFVINEVKPLYSAKKNDLTFFDSLRYKNDAQNTKGSVCITTDNLKNYLPKQTDKVIVKNVLLELAKVLKN